MFTTPTLSLAGLAQVIGNGLGAGHGAALADEQVLGVVAAVGHHRLVAAPGQLRELAKGARREPVDVIEEERPLRRDALHVGVLVLHDAGHQRVVDVPELRDAPAALAEDEPLRGRGAFDGVVRAAEIGGDELALGQPQRFDQVRREKAVLRHDAGRERQFRDAVRDEVEVGGMLGIRGEQLEEAGVVDAVVVVVARVHVQRRLGHGARADVQHVGQPLADRRVQRLVHVGDALPGREVRGPQTGHREARGHRRGRVLALGLDEDQRTARDVDVPLGRRLGPVLAHLRRRRDRVGTGGVAGLALAMDHGAVAVHRRGRSRESAGALLAVHPFSMFMPCRPRPRAPLNLRRRAGATGG